MDKMMQFWRKDGTRSVMASILSILIGLAAGSLLVLVVGLVTPSMSLKTAWEGIRLIFLGIFSTGRNAAGALTFGFNPTSMGNLLFRATPVILTGLSVAVAYNTGLFNIGAPGQYLAGTAVTLFIALSIPTIPDISAVAEQLGLSAMTPEVEEQFRQLFLAHDDSFRLRPEIVWVLAFLGGMTAGALWGAIPGLLKSLLNINEVIACIMTNWIAANLVTWAFDVSNLKNVVENTKTSYIYKTSFNGVATSKMGLDKIFPGSQVNGGIIIAIVLAIVVYIMLTRTTFGYQLKACGSNRFAARYAGIKDKRNIVLSMAIAGAMAGAAGSLYFLSGNTEFFWSTYQTLPAVGFNGIPVALLASNNPIGVIFAGIFMSMLDIAGLQLTNLTAFNEFITDVIIAVIVYLSAFSLVIKMWLGRKVRKQELSMNMRADDQKGASGESWKADYVQADPEAYGIKSNRGLIKLIVLTLLTFGIYGLVFWHRYAKDVNTMCEGDGKNTPGIFLKLLLIILTLGIYEFVWSYQVIKRMQNNASRYGTVITNRPISVVLWKTLGCLLVVGPFIGMYIEIQTINQMAAHYAMYQKKAEMATKPEEQIAVEEAQSK